MTYQIISDSTCDLSPEQIERYNIRLMPLFVHLGDGESRRQNKITAKPKADAAEGLLSPAFYSETQK